MIDYLPDTSVSRTGYAKLDKPLSVDLLIFRTVNSFLSLEVTVFWLTVPRWSPNTPIIEEKLELNADAYNLNRQVHGLCRSWFPSVVLVVLLMMVILGCFLFQIFCRYGSLASLVVTIHHQLRNQLWFLRSKADRFSRNSFVFDRGGANWYFRWSADPVVGYGRSDIDNYVLRFFDDGLVDRTNLFKPTTTQKTLTATAVNTVAETLTITNQ